MNCRALSARLRLFSHNRFNLFAFHDADHGDGSATPLRAQVERQLREAGIDLAGGAIRLLCMPRMLGYGFNPLSIYFCHRADGALAAIIYEVHNTFGERHSYVCRSRREVGDDPAALPQGVLRLAVHGYGHALRLPGRRARTSASRSASAPARRRTRPQRRLPGDAAI